MERHEQDLFPVVRPSNTRVTKTDERGRRIRAIRDRLVREGPLWTRDRERDFHTVTMPECDCDLLCDLLIAESVETIVEAVACAITSTPVVTPTSGRSAYLRGRSPIGAPVHGRPGRDECRVPAGERSCQGRLRAIAVLHAAALEPDLVPRAGNRLGADGYATLDHDTYLLVGPPPSAGVHQGCPLAEVGGLVQPVPGKFEPLAYVVDDPRRVLLPV